MSGKQCSPDQMLHFVASDLDLHCLIILSVLILMMNTVLTLILLFRTTPTFANSVDPDQMASEEAI